MQPPGSFVSAVRHVGPCSVEIEQVQEPLWNFLWTITGICWKSRNDGQLSSIKTCQGCWQWVEPWPNVPDYLPCPVLAFDCDIWGWKDVFRKSLDEYREMRASCTNDGLVFHWQRRFQCSKAFAPNGRRHRSRRAASHILGGLLWRSCGQCRQRLAHDDSWKRSKFDLSLY